MLRVRPLLVIPALLLCACPAADQAPAPDTDPDVAAIQQQIAADSTNSDLYVALSAELRRKNRLDEAMHAAEKAFQYAQAPGTDARLEMAKVHGAAERSAAAINLVKELEKRKRDEGLPVDEVKLAEVYAVVGDVPAVFRWLDRAVQAGSPNVATLATNPDLASVHDDPRWAQYVATTAQ